MYHTHVHFESQYDTGNDKRKMLMNFINSGAKRVAVTEHGVFSSFEDLKELVEDIKAHSDNPIDFDVIPGVEGYLGEDAAHIILIAKDYQGYLDLCKIISESNENVVKGKPIITLENLKKNVNKGHVLCTTACIAGPFGQLLGLKEYNLQKKIENLDKSIELSGYRDFMRIVTEYENKKKEEKLVRPTKKEETDALRIQKKLGSDEAINIIEERKRKSAELLEWLEENKDIYEKAQYDLKQIKKAVYVRKQTNLDNHREELRDFLEKKEQGEIADRAHNIFTSLLQIFGKPNFFFELQNHGLEQEDIIYNNVVKFAFQEGHPQFIASNDIHVGIRKDDPDYEKELLRRNVIKFTRFNKYSEETKDDREYTIKTNDELVEELSKIMKDVDVGTRIIKGYEIAEKAVKNTNILKDISIDFPKDNKYFPKFCDDENEEFEKKVREGIRKKFPNGFPEERKEEYEKRLEYEIDIIKKMGYAGYHLIVADYLEYGRLLGYLPTQEEIDNAPTSIEELDAYITQKGYPRIGYNIGPGRGSAAGSLACYAMGITDIDPIPYNLLFERFLNTERVSMPKQYWAFNVNAITQRCA